MRAITSVLLAVLCALALAHPGTADGAARAAAPVLGKPVTGPTAVTYAGTARPGATVRLQARSALRWSTVRTATATPRGTFRIQAAYPRTGRYYRVVANRRASRSHFVARAAAPALSLPVARDTTVTLTGRARPLAQVRVEFYGVHGWTLARNLTAARLGGFRVELPRASSGRTYRVLSGGRASPTRRVAATAAVESAAKPAPTDACGTRPRRADGTYWSCTFHDDFDGTSLDPAKWLAQETRLSGMTTGSKDCYVRNNSAIRVSDGTVRLTAFRNLTPFTCASPYGSFTSTATVAAVTTKGRFNQAYGRFAFRAKQPAVTGAGAHSGLWLYPDQQTYGAWPHSGEIDVAEWYSAIPGKAYPSLHYSGEVAQERSGHSCYVDAASTTFHTYAVEWSPTRMDFFYDGKRCFSHDWRDRSPLEGSAPFDKAFNMVLTQAWGQLWNAPTSATPNSATLTVDWARAWQ